jgi:hypothetical protein
VRPSRVKRQMSENFRRLFFRQSVVHCLAEMEGDLRDLTGSDQRAYRNQASVTWGQRWAQPEVAEEQVRCVLHDTRSNVAKVLLNCGCALSFRFLVDGQKDRRRLRELVEPYAALREDVLRDRDRG